MNQSINTDSKNSKEPQQKYRLGTVSIKILGGLNRFYRRLTSPSDSKVQSTLNATDCCQTATNEKLICFPTDSCKLQIRLVSSKIRSLNSALLGKMLALLQDVLSYM